MQLIFLRPNRVKLRNSPQLSKQPVLCDFNPFLYVQHCVFKVQPAISRKRELNF